jgi:hypothetical protein
MPWVNAPRNIAPVADEQPASDWPPVGLPRGSMRQDLPAPPSENPITVFGRPSHPEAAAAVGLGDGFLLKVIEQVAFCVTHAL